MSEQADIETALARATAAYKNVRAERDALKDAADRAERAEAEIDRLREALEMLAVLKEVQQHAAFTRRETRDRVDAIVLRMEALAKEAGK